MLMKLNIGKLDRILRITLGGVLLLAFVEHVVSGPIAIVALVMSVIMMLTAILGTCPLYSAIGCNTKKL